MRKAPYMSVTDISLSSHACAKQTIRVGGMSSLPLCVSRPWSPVGVPTNMVILTFTPLSPYISIDSLYPFYLIVASSPIRAMGLINQVNLLATMMGRLNTHWIEERRAKDKGS